MNNENKIILNMWMARDKYKEEASLCLGYLKPVRSGSMWCNFGNYLPLPDLRFKQVTWDDGPVKVKVTIEIVEKKEEGGNDGGTES